MNDHELDDQMRHLAQSYNDPPATPRDAMWERIESARRDAGPVAIGAKPRVRWLRTLAGVAAVLMLGIGIGRLSRASADATDGSTATTTGALIGDTAAGRPETIVAGTSETMDERRAATALASTAQGAESTNRVRATREARLRQLREERSGTASGLAAYAVPRDVQGVVGEGSEMSAYRLAVVEHMARTEVLLTSFLAESRTSPNAARAAQFASLSRDLLKTTRLLLATRATEDQALTRLLEDLELVLMQISQYTAEGRRGDLDAINQSLDRRNVLPKLRSSIPAGASASTGI